MSNIGCLMWGANLFMNLSRKYDIINADPERKANTIYFGLYAIGASIITCVVFVLCALGIFACLGAMGSGLGDLLLWAFIALLIILALFCLAELVAGGVMGIVYQLRCNKRHIWWIALLVLIASVAALVVAIIFIAPFIGVEL